MSLTHNQGELLYWIIERENVRRRKEGGNPAPWSYDPVFHNTYFCNVNREDDRVTKWIRENWLFKNNSLKPYTLGMIVARIFNKPITMEAIRQPPVKGVDLWFMAAKPILQDRQLDGEKIWSGAYLISTNGKKMDKLDYCFDLFSEYWRGPHHWGADTLAETHKMLTKINGIGSFLAAQVIADLKNTPDHPLAWADDWDTFSAPGPGSLRGLGWFWDKPITPSTFANAIEKAYALTVPHLPSEIESVLCMQNFQNCLCEYDKYMRIKNGTGRSKRRYNATGGK